jgi:hypothetical protein
MGIAGDLGRYTQFSAAEAMTKAAENPSSGMGAGMGMGMGVVMGQQGPWGAAPAQAPAAAAAPPPPPPTEHVGHIAENGAPQGPFSTASMGRMVVDGALTRQTMVWTPGQDGWKPAGEVVALARVFTVMPPPPPPGV